MSLMAVILFLNGMGKGLVLGFRGNVQGAGCQVEGSGGVSAKCSDVPRGYCCLSG